MSYSSDFSRISGTSGLGHKAGPPLLSGERRIDDPAAPSGAMPRHVGKADGLFLKEESSVAAVQRHLPADVI